VSLPQQTTAPLGLAPQPGIWPALTAVKVPAGGDDSPEPSVPQQAILPFVRRPQLWSPPALTAVKVPAGGVD
jgi:hypothetical protein